MFCLFLYKNVQVVIWEYIHLELPTNERTCARQENRASTFWEVEFQCCGNDFFKQNFRLKRRAFQKLCSFLDHIKKKKTNFQNSICLGNGTIEECVDGFKSIGFPQCLGALDGCHIEIRPRTEEAVDYINYKGWYSTVLLALVDARYRFLYINVGSPGRCNDSKIFEKSSLKRELDKCSLLNSMSTKLGNFDIPVVILGDSAFRFFKYLMKPFPFSLDKTPAQKTFNYQLSKSRSR
ncbi:PREDICTED: uncharacterized protein LOC108362151 [Rhagoletis zephyria]|uniref:uncharacterized protein LOC108362151 n=1 Tax=Rhagoletis zephyria TaxID=28612 RepID=UPI0008113A0B|nr:PREDICTED: uncharacterized protein LOC108362151 [Rhagoletis zephyria]XP_036340391.1 uncharacterized protein LOC118749708 [Rhagoletis pomonella]